jgi:hypothetical protein
LRNPEYPEKSLKIPKEKSESVYRRRTDNTMAKRKSTKGRNKDSNYQQTTTQKTKEWATHIPQIPWMNSGSPEV